MSYILIDLSAYLAYTEDSLMLMFFMYEAETRNKIDLKAEMGGRLPWYLEESRNEKAKAEKFVGFWAHFFGSGNVFDYKKIKKNWNKNKTFRKRAGNAISVPREFYPTHVGNAGRAAAIFDTIDRGLGIPGKFMMKSDELWVNAFGFIYNLITFPVRVVSYLGKKISEAATHYFIKKRYTEESGVSISFESLEKKVEEHDRKHKECFELVNRIGDIEERLNYIDKNEATIINIEDEKIKLEKEQQKIKARQKELTKTIARLEEEIDENKSKWLNILKQQEDRKREVRRR